MLVAMHRTVLVSCPMRFLSPTRCRSRCIGRDATRASSSCDSLWKITPIPRAATFLGGYVSTRERVSQSESPKAHWMFEQGMFGQGASMFGQVQPENAAHTLAECWWSSVCLDPSSVALSAGHTSIQSLGWHDLVTRVLSCRRMCGIAASAQVPKG